MADTLDTLTLRYSRTLLVDECCNCSMTYAVPEDFDKRRRQDGGTFYCPAGHPQSYTKSEIDKLRDKAASEERRRKSAEAGLTAARDQAAAAERRASARKGVITRMRNKIAAGQCQECEQEFPDLGAHVTAYHPGYAAGDPDA
jgi:hypothetical protein